MEITLINQDDQQYAHKKLEKYYKDSLIPAEKKAYLTELQNNIGPYMGIESDKGQTHYLMDAASQIATLGLGFSPSVFTGIGHHIASWTNNPNNKQFLSVKDALHTFLMRKTGWSQLDMTLCNSGAESNEIALGYAYRRRLNKDANKVLAFEGSFHGRMLISLFSTWNKTKREPFQRSGYETLFNSYPELPGDDITQAMPQDWRKHWDLSSQKDFKLPTQWTQSSDVILSSECDSLLGVREKLLTGKLFAIIIEPMQCEGGDRYASDRFYTALVIMAKSFGVPVIFDEVQTGFHLGREFFWHRQFNLKDQNGDQLNPDYVVCAKKAQVGMILSPLDLNRNKLERREQFQVPSVIRGYYHALALDQSQERIISIEKYVQKKLGSLLEIFPKNLSRARLMGLSFAFNVDTNENVMTYISKRFNHGLLYYPAGSHTLRFRLNTSYTFEDIDFLFERLTEISHEIYSGKESSFNSTVTTNARRTDKVNHWQNIVLSQRLKRMNGGSLDESSVITQWNSVITDILGTKSNAKLVKIDAANFETYAQKVEQMQKDIYEPTRQTSIERFKVCADSDYGINFVIDDGENILAMAFSSSLKDHPLDRGLRQDPDYDNPKSLYMIDTTVKADSQKFGLGRLLKFIVTSIAITKDYHSIKGRNRDRLAAGMLNINLSLGAFEENYLREDYPDFEEYRDVLYYSCPLEWSECNAQLGNATNGALSTADIDESFIKEQLPYLTNKVCLSNFVSENFLSHVKAILEQTPQVLRHGYTASGQSECVDKIYKSLIYNDKEKFDNDKFLVTFNGHYFGNGSFLSRSLSTEENDAFFPVKKIDINNLKELEELISKDQVSSVWLEPVLQKTFEAIPKETLKQVKEICSKNETPVIYNETAAQKFQHNDTHYFASNDSDITPNAMMAFLGGQAAIVAIEEKHFVAKPLMMISTWDGDEHAFASYHRAMERMISNKESYLKVRDSFHNKVNEELAQIIGANYKLNKGKGLLSGNAPKKWHDLLMPTEDGLLIDATFSEMENYCD